MTDDDVAWYAGFVQEEIQVKCKRIIYFLIYFFLRFFLPFGEGPGLG